ncbi:hypothetical protein, conserved [Leishmania tarentolae]|uniref:WLM domain-containing protein n=1 Tax=Leishmania tarentolae TaxID=5689 RepID=A0A640KQR9_LEITA|nr:hypothetical protein, conserved [Leishmania tarentolae]
MSSAFMAQLPLIGSSSTLGWQRDDVAQSYMEHVLRRARVLLSRRGWRIGLIKEFYPRGATLLGLNVNAGSEVCIRFRVPGKKNEFLPFHEVLCTALHEFTHCVHSRHDRSFWNLYYDLVKECEALEITMIQQGMQLYPEIPATPMSSRGTASRQSFSGHGNSSTAAVTGSARGGGRRLSNRGARGDGHRRGGVMSTGSSNPTQTIARTGRMASRLNSSPLASAAFPGEGRRLGGGSLPQYDSTSSSTPTREALRRILAGAAERRLLQTPPSAVTLTLGSRPRTLSVDRVTSAEQGDAPSEVDDDDVPDCVPHNLLETQDGGGWSCPRCGFRNDDCLVGSCAFCADGEDGEEWEATAIKRQRLENDRSPLEVPKAASCSAIASKMMPLQEPEQREVKSKSKEHYIVVSDEEDS